MTDFWPKKWTVSLWERQFATLYLFHAYTPPPLPKKRSQTAPPPPPAPKRGIYWHEGFLLQKERNPVLPFLVFLESLVFFFPPPRGIPCFSSVFPFFSRDSRGSAGIKNPCFFGGFPCLLPKKKNKERKDREKFQAPIKLAQPFLALELWPGSSPTDPQTPKNSKTRKSDSKVTFGVPVKVTQKLLKSDSKVTFSTVFVTFESLLSNFWVTFIGTPKVTFESLISCLWIFRGLGVCRATSGSQP